MSIPVPTELAARGPARATIPRRPESVRRTSTFDATWPAGRGTATQLQGRARDLFTPARGAARTLGEARVRLIVGRDKRIVSISSEPARPGLAALAGAPSISGYRALLAEAVPDDAADGTLPHFLLDDVPGASLVSGYAATRWYGDYTLPLTPAGKRRAVVGLCTGFQEGSSGLQPDGTSRRPTEAIRVEEIDAGAEPAAWHELVAATGVAMRRSRRIDVWVEDDAIRVDAFFQDSTTMPDGSRAGLHEYTLTVAAGLGDRVLREVIPVPRVLPHGECPLAVANVEAMIGVPLGDLRSVVRRELAGVAGCTHLNDMLRSLADVPVLTDALLRTDSDAERKIHD